MRLAAGMHGRCATSHLWMVPPGQKRRNSSAVFRRCMWHLRDSARSGSQRGASQSPALRPCDPQAQRVLRIGAPSFRRAGKSRAAVPRALLRTATSATKLSSSVTGSTDPSVERTHQAKVRRTLAYLAPWCTGRTWPITCVGRAALILASASGPQALQQSWAIHFGSMRLPSSPVPSFHAISRRPPPCVFDKCSAATPNREKRPTVKRAGFLPNPLLQYSTD